MPETHLPDPAGAQMAAARDEAHHGPSWRGPRRGTALCLSGGGFRAALFHLGALRRLNELGMLGQLRTVSAVSGGSIAAMLLAAPRLGWPDADALSQSIDSADLVEPDPSAPPLPRGDTVPGGLFSAPRVTGFEEYVAEPVRRLTSRNLRTRAMVSGFGPKVRRSPDTSSRMLADQLVGQVDWWATDLRDAHRTSGPAVVVEATELAHGVNWTFADPRAHAPRGRVGDYRLGYGEPPAGLRLADVVAASSAYPPYFAPFDIDASTLDLTGGRVGQVDAAARPRISRTVQLLDGGIYDNLALEPVWRDHASVLVSDGGAVFRARSARTPLGRILHVISIAAGGGEVTRLRWLHSAFNWGVLEGASWAMDSRVPQSYPVEVAAQINQIRTDMDAFSDEEQKIIERHGYGVADSAIRRYAPQLIMRDAPARYPYPEVADPEVALRALRGSGRMSLVGRRAPRRWARAGRRQLGRRTAGRRRG
ncbi:patatin-like phospholipase family protein [Kytococcus sp. Marseille-QA3725]